MKCKTILQNIRLGVVGTSTVAIAIGTFAISSNVFADSVILDDLIVDGSICAGQDCVNGESFGFDTLRLKENNLRIKAQDTSNSASFPTNDWQITFNDSSNGGANKFSIDDIDGGKTPFTIEASAPSHSLYVDDGGRIGLGTSTPVVELHVVNGDSPTIRLEQDGSSGFTPQIWDVAGNETNFFIRDATNGSPLPFRIRPSAPQNSLYIDTDGDVGLGTASPDAQLHVVGNGLLVGPADMGAPVSPATIHAYGSDGATKITVEDTGATFGVQAELIKNGTPRIRFDNTNNAAAAAATNAEWDIGMDGSHNFIFRSFETEQNVFSINSAGALTIAGSITTGGVTCGSGCDTVFSKGFKLPTIKEHTDDMWKKGYLPNIGPTVENQPFNLTEKLGRMLNELETAHIYISELHSYTYELQSRLEKLEARLSSAQN